MAQPINPSREPLAQVRIIRSESDTLCIKTDHMVTDAFSLKQYSYMLASTYGELAVNPQYKPAPSQTCNRSLRQVSSRFGILDKLRIIRRGMRDLKRRFQPARYWAFPYTDNKTTDKIFITRTLSKDRFSRIKEYGHRHNATVNEIMIAAYCRALLNIIKPESDVSLRLLCTVDLRRYLSTEKTGSMSNLANFAYLNIGTQAGNTLNDTIIKIHNDMTALKNDYLGLGDYPITVLLFNLFPFAVVRPIFNILLKSLIRSGNAAPIFSNTGILDHEKLTFDNLTPVEAYIPGPTFYPPFFSMAICSFRQAFTLSISFPEASVERQTIEKLLDHIDSELP
jgi:NRPS condensation-like uncharacterized protein